MIPEISPVNNYSGDGFNTLFDFDFLIENEKQLLVLHTDKNSTQTVLSNGVDYSIDGIENINGGKITFPLENSKYDILKEDEKISLILDLPLQQSSEFGASDKLDLNMLEKTFDYVIRCLQILSRQQERSFKVQEGADSTPSELLSLINEAKDVSAQNASASISAMNSTNKNLEIVEELANQVSENKNEVIEINSNINQIIDSFTPSIEAKANKDLVNSEPAFEFRELVVSWLTPDLANGISITPARFNASKKWLQMPCACLVWVSSTNNQDYEIFISPDTTNILLVNSHHDSYNGLGSRCAYVYVPKDYYVSCHTTNTESTAKYFPLKGVNS